MLKSFLSHTAACLLFSSPFLAGAWQAQATEIPASIPEQPETFAQDTDESVSETAADKEKSPDDEDSLSLKPERSLNITTDEATWLSLDISPDGSTIVMDILGDLYTLPAEGGEATLLMGGMAFDTMPSYSPDGSMITFISDRSGENEVWITNADGSEPKKLSTANGLTSYSMPSWSPDGQYVIVSKVSWSQFTNEIWMYHIKGGAGFNITSFGTQQTPSQFRRNTLGVQASPDGRYLYFAEKLGGFQYNAQSFNWSVSRHDLETGETQTIVTAQGGAFAPRLSPDGQTLVYGTRQDNQTGLRVRNLESGEDKWLIFPIQKDEQEALFSRDLLPGYTFTPDGSAILTTYMGKINRVELSDGSISIIPFEADINLDLGPNLHLSLQSEEGSVESRLIMAPRQAPNGESIVFSSMGGVYVAGLDDLEPRKVSDDIPAYEPVWSPDGRWVAYVTYDNGGGHVWRARANGRGNPERLTDIQAFYYTPAWSPDGKTIVVQRGSNEERVTSVSDFGAVSGSDIIAIDVDSREVRLVKHLDGIASITPSLGFTDDPDRIYYYRGGTVSSMHLDGTDIRNHLSVRGRGAYTAAGPVPANNVKISPNGKFALAFASNQLYVLAVPPANGETPAVVVMNPQIPLKQITDMGANYFAWADDNTITWSTGSTFYRQSFDPLTFFDPEEEEEETSEEMEETDDASIPAEEEATESDASESTEETGEKAEEAPKPFKEEHETVEAFKINHMSGRDVPEGTLLITNARLITMGEAGIIEEGDILIRNNRIEAVGPSGTLDVPENTDIVDMRGKTITPGFVDTHAHWFHIRRGVLDVNNWVFPINVAYGVTSGLDVQTFSGDQFAYQDMIDAGDIIGPRAWSTGPGVFYNNAINSSRDAESVLRWYKEHYRTSNIKAYLSGNRKTRQYIIEAAKKVGIMPTTEGGLDLHLDLTHMIDGFSGNEHSLPVYPLSEDVVELAAQSRIGYTPTLLVLYGGIWAENYFHANYNAHDDEKMRRLAPHVYVDSVTSRRPVWVRDEEHSFDDVARQAAKIQDAGGLVGIGSHGQFQGLGYHYEMWAYEMGREDPYKTLEAATITGATIIGRENEVGSLEAGKFADLVILDENPLEDIHNTTAIHRVMKNGRLYDDDTMDEVWPRQREYPRQWFEDAEPPARNAQ